MYYKFLLSEVSCSDCGWSGTGDDIRCGALFAEVFEYHCPTCGAMLGCCSLPTTEEARANWDIVPEKERRQIRKEEESRARFDRLRLRRANQLPDIDSESIDVQWDYERVEGSESYTVLRHGDQVLWREPAVWEGEKRFLEVVAIVRRKYGESLRSVVPTEASWLWLYGDRISTPDLRWDKPPSPVPDIERETPVEAPVPEEQPDD